MRRGKLVEIPPDWVDKTAHPQTIRKRQSKQPRKQEMRYEGHTTRGSNGARHTGHPKNHSPRHVPERLHIDTEVDE